MKLIKYLFFLIILIFVVGSLYVATVSLPSEERIEFETPIHPELFKQKLQDFSTYTYWMVMNDENLKNSRLNNPENFENATLSWQNSNFEKINLQNTSKSQDSLAQTITLSTWLSTSEIDLIWKFKHADTSMVTVELKTDPSFWQKTEFVFYKTSHLSHLKTSIENSLNNLEDVISKEIAEFEITAVGKIETETIYLLHATSAARLNFENIVQKSQPIFESIEDFMTEQNFKAYKGRIILFENIYESSNNVIFSPGIGTRKQTAIPDSYEILSKPIEGSIYFKTQLLGNLVNLRELVNYANSVLEDRGLGIDKRLKPYLEFEVNATHTINPSEWVTNYYIPIIQ